MAYLGNNNLPFDPTRTVAAPRDADRFSGNGSTTSFTLSRFVSSAVDIEVFVENVQQEPLTAYDVINGNTLNFTGAPPSGTNNVYVVYRNFQTGAQVTMPDGSVTYNKLANNLRIFTTDNLIPNGSTVAFTMSEQPADANTVMVTIDGIVQRAPVHYTTSGSTITFTSAPVAGSNVHVRHLGFRTSATVTQLAANSTISQPTIESPVITGTARNGLTYVSEMYVGNTSSKVGGFGTGIGYVANFQNANTVANQQSIISISLSGQTPQSEGMIVGIDSSQSYLWNRDDKYISLGTNNTSRFRVPASNGDFLATSNGSSTLLPAFFCRAWLTGWGVPTMTTYGSGNVSSWTNPSGANYTINFVTAMPDTNYSVTCFSEGGTDVQRYFTYSARNTTSFQYSSGYQGPSGAIVAAATGVHMLAVFR